MTARKSKSEGWPEKVVHRNSEKSPKTLLPNQGSWRCNPASGGYREAPAPTFFLMLSVPLYSTSTLHLATARHSLTSFFASGWTGTGPHDLGPRPKLCQRVAGACRRDVAHLAHDSSRSVLAAKRCSRRRTSAPRRAAASQGARCGGLRCMSQGGCWAIRAAARQGASSSPGLLEPCLHRKAAEEVISLSMGSKSALSRKRENESSGSFFFFKFRQSTPSSGSAAAAVPERAPEAGAARGTPSRGRKGAEPGGA